MPVYASMFASGLEPLMKECLPRVLRGSEIYDVYNGLIIYRYNGRPEMIRRLTMCSNTYMVLLRMNNPSFASLVKKASADSDNSFINRVRHGDTYRIRFQRNGKLERVDDSIRQTAEQLVRRKARLNVNRETPDWEFWYIIRSEGIGFYGLLVNKREATERDLPQGALRPEIAQSMCLYAGITGRDTVLDPFAGYGSIPAQVLKMHRSAPIYCIDNDPDAVRRLKKRFERESEAGLITIERADATILDSIASESIDKIITDPPWGIFDKDRYENLGELYNRFMEQARRVLRRGGIIVLLSGAKTEAAHAAKLNGFAGTGRMDILVNGKKAALMRYSKR